MNLLWGDIPPLGSSLAITVATVMVAICVAQKLSTLLSHRDSRVVNDPYQITKCPNPNCARCSRYEELNRSAQKRLPWIMKKHPDLTRIRNAIAAGPGVADNEESSLAINEDQRVDVRSPVKGQRPNVLLIRGLKTRPIVTDLHQNACHVVENLGKDVILNEYRNAVQSHSASALENDVRQGTWEVLHLLNQGSWIQTNSNLCPKTIEAVQSIEGIMNGCIFGNIFISVLYPGTIVDPHCGPTNVRHRLHFPLVVPTLTSSLVGSEPELRVAKERITWTELECIVFDDSIVHSASYPGEKGIGKHSLRKGERNDARISCRVVLIVDLWHPELSAEERKAISDLYPTGS